jgi:hypothetical protein
MGAMWRPYKPSSFIDSTETMRGLFKQGPPLAFYKGNGVRALHIFLFHKLNTDLTFRAEKWFGLQWKTIKETPLASELILSCAVDLVL